MTFEIEEIPVQSSYKQGLDSLLTLEFQTFIKSQFVSL